MKLPGSLFKTYKTYKQDTDRLTQWLGSTAVAAGFAGVLGQDGGRDEALAEGNGRPPSTTITLLKTDDIVTLAEYIAQAKPPIRVPFTILECATRAVVARRKCANWFLSLSSTPAVDDNGIDGRPGPDPAILSHQNSTHLHFISILERVISLLSPCVPMARNSAPRRQSSGSPSLTTRPTTLKTTNTFSPLSPDLCTPSVPCAANDDADQQAAVHNDRGGRANGKKAAWPVLQQQYRMANEDDEVDLVFIVHSYYAEIQHIRQFVKDTWTQYRDGKLDLASASFTTSCAVDLVRDAQQEMYTVFPAFTPHSFVSMIRLVYLQACLLRKEHPFSTDAYLTYNEATMDLADFLLMQPAHLAMEFAGLYEKMPVDTLNLAEFFANTFDMWGRYDPLVDRSQLSHRDKYHEDSTLLISHSHFIHGLAIMGDHCPFPILDAFTLELGKLTTQFARKGKLCEPVVAFVTQVFFDIHHILRDRACHGYNDLKSTTVSMLASLDAFDPDLYSDTGKVHANVPSCMGFLRSIANNVVDDVFSSIAGRPPEFKFLKAHPWLCGLIQHRLLDVYHNWAIAASINWGSIPSSCHLYEAARREGFLGDATVWADMEYVMRMHTKAGMFRGKVPSNRIEAFSSLLSVRGAPAVQVSLATREVMRGKGRLRKKAGQNTTVVANRGEDHRPPEPCPLTSWLREWFGSRTNWLSPYLAIRTEMGLMDLARTRHHTHDPHLQSLTEYSSSSSAAARTPATTPSSSLPINPHTSQPYYVCNPDENQDAPSLAGRTAKDRMVTQLPALVLLTSLRDALHRESAFLQFDYWGFHLRCIRLHHVLVDATQVVRSAIALDRIHAGPMLTEDIVTDLFHFASPVMRPCHPKSPDHALATEALHCAFQALVDFIGQEGNAEAESMRKREKYVALRAQVPSKDARPPDHLWHPFTVQVANELQSTWDRDVTPWNGLDNKLVDMIKNREELELVGMKVSFKIPSKKVNGRPRPIR